MPLPKLVAVTVCASVLGAQILISSPLSPERHGWYWPFLAYPMYAEAHFPSDSLVVPELRVASCGSDASGATLMTDSLAVPRNQLLTLLVAVARAPESDGARRAEARLSRAVEAHYPARYCSASAWMRVVRVADTSTYHLRMPMRRVAAWPLGR